MEPSTQDLCPSRLFSTVVFPISPTNILNLECHRYNPTTHGTFHAIIQVTLPPLYFPGSISCSHCLAGRPNRTQVASLLQGGVVGGGLCHLYLPPRKLAYYPKRGYLKRFQPSDDLWWTKFDSGSCNVVPLIGFHPHILGRLCRQHMMQL